MDWLVDVQSLRPKLSPRPLRDRPQEPGCVLDNLPQFLNRRCSILKLCRQNYVWRRRRSCIEQSNKGDLTSNCFEMQGNGMCTVPTHGVAKKPDRTLGCLFFYLPKEMAHEDPHASISIE